MSDDESISRLLAADPARGHATDLAALRRAVDTRLETDPERSAPATPAPRDELAERRVRRSRRMSWVAGAAASVIVGVSGYLVGAGGAGGGGGDSAGGAAEDVDTFVASEGAEADTGIADDSGAGEATEQTDELGVMSGSDGSSGPAGESEGRVAFEASGLTDERTAAEAFAYDATGVATAERAQQLADALGVAGAAVQEGTAWVVADGEGRRVAIEGDGAATLGYSDPTVTAGACADVRGDVSDPDDLGTCEAVDDPITTARDFLTRVGVDSETLELVIGASSLGEVVVDGYPAGSDPAGQPVWSVVVTAGGVSTATGPLAPLIPIGSYEVISPVEAVARLGDSRFGAFVTGQVTQIVSQDQGTWTPSEGGTLPWAVTTHTITGADLVLAGYPLGGGAVGVLPTWRLTSEDGGTWSVIAVTDKFLDFGASGD